MKNILEKLLNNHCYHHGSSMPDESNIVENEKTWLLTSEAKRPKGALALSKDIERRVVEANAEPGGGRGGWNKK